MNRLHWRWAVGVVAAVALLVPAAVAWACVGLMSLTTNSSTVPPGGTVKVFGKEFAQGQPIEIHLGSTTGPVLATVPPPTDTMTSQWAVDVTIPANIPPGEHFLVATQAYHYMNAGTPARATISVGTPATVPPPPAPRPARVSVESGPSAIVLILIALAVAIIGLAIAGLWTAAAARRGSQPQTTTEEAR